MDSILSKKGLFIVIFVIFSLFAFWLIKSMVGKLEITTNITLSVTSLPTVNDVIRQIKQENEKDNKSNNSSNNSSNNGSSSNKPSLKDEIAKSKNKLSKSDFKKVNSEYEQMTEHINKLEEYKANPYKFDNKGFLKNATNDQVKQQVINGRIEHLETEIKTFYDNIVKTLSNVQ